jgi:hypothetical protein
MFGILIFNFNLHNTEHELIVRYIGYMHLCSHYMLVNLLSYGSRGLHSLKSSGSYIYYLLEHTVTLHFEHRAYLWPAYDFQSKQHLFP